MSPNCLSFNVFLIQGRSYSVWKQILLLHVWVHQGLQTCSVPSALLLAAVGWTSLTCFSCRNLQLNLKDIHCSSANSPMTILSPLSPNYALSLSLRYFCMMNIVHTARNFLPQIYEWSPSLGQQNYSKIYTWLTACFQNAVLSIYSSPSVFLSFALNVILMCCSWQMDSMSKMSGTNATVHLQLLRQTKWLEWGLTDRELAGTCGDTFTEVQLQRDVVVDK